MLEAILNILIIMGWLGIILGILAIVNITTQTLVNIWNKGENFNWRKMIKGVVKVLVFFISSAFISIAFTILPFVNTMINKNFRTWIVF